MKDLSAVTREEMEALWNEEEEVVMQAEFRMLQFVNRLKYGYSFLCKISHKGTIEIIILLILLFIFGR